MRGTYMSSYLPSAVVNAAAVVLHYCDLAGERLAYMFGITSPKYHREIDEYYRIKKQEEELIKKQHAEYAGWCDSVKIVANDHGEPADN